MARRPSHKKHIRNIQRSGGSYHISIPIDIIRKLSWRERQKVVVRAFGKGKIVIKDWKK